MEEKYCMRSECKNHIPQHPYCRFLRTIRPKYRNGKEVVPKININPCNCMYYQDKKEVVTK